MLMIAVLMMTMTTSLLDGVRRLMRIRIPELGVADRIRPAEQMMTIQGMRRSFLGTIRRYCTSTVRSSVMMKAPPGGDWRIHTPASASHQNSRSQVTVGDGRALQQVPWVQHCTVGLFSIPGGGFYSTHR